MPRYAANRIDWQRDTKTYDVCDHLLGYRNQYSTSLASWIAGLSSFAFEGESGRFSAQRETKQRGSKYWYAYLKNRNKFYKAYLGKTDELTLEHLEAIAQQLRVHAGSL